MDEKLRRLLQEDMEKEADKLMEEVNQDPSLANVKAPEEIYDKLSAQIREYEANKVTNATNELSEEDKELIRLGKIYKKRRKWNKVLVLAAAMVLALALGVTSIGGPKRVFEEVKWILGGKEHTNIDTDDERIEEPDAVSEVEAYEKIEEEFGFYPVRLFYLPDGMKFAEMIVGDDLQRIQLLYEKQEKVGLYYYIHTNYRLASIGTEMDDELIEEYIIERDNVNITVEQYKVSENNECRWRASFVYGKNKYFIEIIDLGEEEVIKIVENLYFS